VLPLEGQRRALRIMLVVGPARARGLRDPGELPLQRRDPLPHPGPLSQQHLPRGRHSPDDNGHLVEISQSKASWQRHDSACPGGCRVTIAG
jgi:hypothetical protein